MRFFIPKFEIATLQPPQTTLRSKFGGLPWGLPLERWSRCERCQQHMSLLAQLLHDPPALDLGGEDNVLHLFQCQACFGFEPAFGNDAVIISRKDLGDTLAQFPIIDSPSGDTNQMVGELWITGWTEHDDGLDSDLAKRLYDQDQWMQLPPEVCLRMFEPEWRTKMGGVPYWTGNGPQQKPKPGYEFLFQLDDAVQFEGAAPSPDAIGGMVIATKLVRDGDYSRIAEQDYHAPQPGNRKFNAPSVNIDVDEPNNYLVDITNFGTDGTAYVFINRNENPPLAYWYWTR